MNLHPLAMYLLTLVSFSAVATATAPSNLAGYWKLDDALGSAQAVDETQTSNGTLFGNPTFLNAGASAGSNALHFDGNGDWMEIPHHDDFLLDSGMIVFWFKADAISGRKGLLGKDATNYTTGGHITFFLEGNGRVRLRLQSTTASYDLYSTSLAQVDQWHHLAVVFGVGGLELYFDGVLEDSDAYEGGLGTTSGGTGNYEPIVLGANPWASGNLSATPLIEYFPGTIDEVGILSERWDSSTIAALYSQTGPGTDMDLGEFAGPQTFYVRTQGLDTNDGLTPQTSFRTIQKAVNLCTRAGTTVYVGAGVYQESIEIGTGAGIDAISGTELLPINLIADTTGANTFDDPGAVIIDGQSVSISGITLLDRTNWVFQGLTLRNQVTNGIHGTNAGMSILDCTIDVPAGYAVYATASGDITVADCTFERSPGDKHMIWVTPNNTTTPTSVTITRNDATLKGDLYMSTGLELGMQSIPRESWGTAFTYGIVVFGWGQPLIERVEISNNQLSDCYLSIFVGVNSTEYSETIIANNTVVGAFYSIYSSTLNNGTASVINNIIDTSYLGLITYTQNGATVTVNALIENAITASMAQYNRSFEFDIIQEAPNFTNAQAGEFSLVQGSTGIDAGAATNAPAIDIAGFSRPTDGNDDGIAQINIGAHELVTPRARIKVVQWREIGVDADR